MPRRGIEPRLPAVIPPRSNLRNLILEGFLFSNSKFDLSCRLYEVRSKSAARLPPTTTVSSRRPKNPDKNFDNTSFKSPRELNPFFPIHSILLIKPGRREFYGGRKNDNGCGARGREQGLRMMERNMYAGAGIGTAGVMSWTRVDGAVQVQRGAEGRGWRREDACMGGRTNIVKAKAGAQMRRGDGTHADDVVVDVDALVKRYGVENDGCGRRTKSEHPGVWDPGAVSCAEGLLDALEAVETRRCAWPACKTGYMTLPHRWHRWQTTLRRSVRANV
ncbi:hypothetical protein C8R44DRAFT_856367 [Mycena epipterygia]|nr:hypothetical protein C8R44DRAFT_856367 [Mycena epipterygia]